MLYESFEYNSNGISIVFLILKPLKQYLRQNKKSDSRDDLWPDYKLTI